MAVVDAAVLYVQSKDAAPIKEIKEAKARLDLAVEALLDAAGIKWEPR